MTSNQTMSKKPDHDSIVQPMNAATVGGVGVPSGASKSPWGDTFLNRKKFFEENAGQKDEDESEDQPLSRLTRSSSRSSSRSSRRSLRRSTSTAQSSTKVVSPDHHHRMSPSSIPLSNSISNISHHQGNSSSSNSSSPNGVGGGGRSSNNGGVMSHETGQKERMADTHSSQSDHDEDPAVTNIGRGVVKPEPIRLIVKDPEPEKRKYNNVSRVTSPRVTSPRSTSVSPSPVDLNSSGLQTHLLDGRPVHNSKENRELSTSSPDNMVPSSASAMRQKQSLTASNSDNDLLERITSLMTEKKRLDAKLVVVSDENRSLHEELLDQHNTITSLKGLSNDIKKQKDALQHENIKLSKSLASTEKQRDTLLMREQELLLKEEKQDEKMTKIEELNQITEEHNKSLTQEIKALRKTQDSLRLEKDEIAHELLQEKSNKQSHINDLKKARDKISSLEREKEKIVREKESVMKEKDRNQRLVVDEQKKLTEKNKKFLKAQKECEELKKLVETLQSEKVSISVKLDQSTLENQQMKRQMDEVRWEKQQVEQRMGVVRQTETDLRASIDKLLSDLNKETKKVIPGLDLRRGDVPVGGGGTRPLNSSPDALKKVRTIQSAILGELVTATKKKDESDKRVLQLESQLNMKQRVVGELKVSLKDSQTKLENERDQFKREEEKIVNSSEAKLREFQEEITTLKNGNKLLEDTNTKLQEDLELLQRQSTEQLDSIKTELTNEQTLVQDYEKQVARLLVQQVIVSAQSKISEKVQVENDISYEQLKKEREQLSMELKELQQSHASTCNNLDSRGEELRNQKLETKKVKMHLTTEIELLKAQITLLEKEKTELKNKPASIGSAFQPINQSIVGTTRKLVTDPLQENNQRKEIMELKHKLMIMEADNKRLLDLTQTSSTMMDAGNVLRKHALEMRKRCIFLESEKKQLTEKVHTLHTSVKALRESKDRMISDRLRALQSENISLQDNIRTSETMFNKKLMSAASRIAETLKENDKLRCTLGHLRSGIGNIDTIISSLTQLSTSIQRQEQELATLRASLAGSGNNLTPAVEISERILKTHAELQAVLALRQPSMKDSNEVGGSGHSLSSDAASTRSSQFLLTGTTPSDMVPPIGRARSHSQSVSSPVPTYVLQIREKLSQLYADNRSIFDLIKHGQVNLDARQNDVSRLRDKLFSLLANINVSVKIMHESHDQLVSLNQQTLSVEQLTSIEFLEHEVENWQDKVFACEIALKDIETRMQEDYESHNQRFSQLMSQILDLKEENSTKRDKLIANEQYIHDIEERCLNAENELFKLRKEMESVLQEALKLPDGIVQLPSHGGHVSEVIRSQNEDLTNLRVLLSSSTYHQSRLQAKVESIHRENSILKHQALENDRHHSKILEELYKERDYLRKMNSQLIERQLKTEEAGDMLKKIKRSQEAEKEQRDFKKLSAELNNIEFALREKDMAISELQHQLENQQLEQLKLQSLSANDPMIGPPPPITQSKLVHQPQSRMRPLSATCNSVDLARQSRYRIIDHMKNVDRNAVESSSGAGHFMISIPGDSKQFNLESGTKSTEEGYILGFPVVTDDEGPNFATTVSQKKRRHRRTASEGSDSLKSLISSGSSASDSKPTKPFHSTLPRQPHPSKEVVPAGPRPGSVESFSYSPINTPTPAAESTTQQDAVGKFAQKLSEQMGEMIHQHDSTIDDSKPTKLESSSIPVKIEKGSASEKVGSKSERFSKLKNLRSSVFGMKGNIPDKDKNSSGGKPLDEDGPGLPQQASKLGMPHLRTTIDEPNKSDETSSSSNGGSNQVSRMESFASTVDRSNSFASTVSTTYSELGGESSPYSTYSLDSFSITDSIDNMLILQDKSFQRGHFFTPINHQNYTSSSDDETRYNNNGSGGNNRTLKRTAPLYHHKDFPLFPPSINHHRTTSSCDSDQLLANSAIASGRVKSADEKRPVHRNESISISDMDKEFTDQEDVQDRIHGLKKRLEKVRRSSTGSITIWNHSGSSMEDIKNAGD